MFSPYKRVVDFLQTICSESIESNINYTTKFYKGLHRRTIKESEGVTSFTKDTLQTCSVLQYNVETYIYTTQLAVSYIIQGPLTCFYAWSNTVLARVARRQNRHKKAAGGGEGKEGEGVWETTLQKSISPFHWLSLTGIIDHVAAATTRRTLLPLPPILALCFMIAQNRGCFESVADQVVHYQISSLRT